MRYNKKLLRRLAEKVEPLRPFPIPGWVHNGNWIVRSGVHAGGRSVESLNEESAAKFISKHVDAAWEPLEHVGFAMLPKWADGTGNIFARLFEGPAGVIAIDEDYAVLLDGLMPVHLLTDVRERSPIGGIDDQGVLQCWITPVFLRHPVSAP